MADAGVSALIALVIFASAARAENALPEPLESPDRGVVCNRRTQICYDRFGPSIGLTGIFCGQAAAQRLLAALREQPAAESAGASFSLAEGVRCVRETGLCRVRGEPHTALTAALYPPRR